jgi:hypothetical protein
MSDRVAVYTTVYPGVEPYLGDWYRSVRGQTDRCFDLWIGVDGLTRDKVTAACRETPTATWIDRQATGAGAGVRAAAIARMSSVYDAVVFVDSDDVLAPTRVAAARAALEEHDVAGCALRIIDAAGRDAGALFGLPSGWTLADVLPRYNVLGLSNTAYRTGVLRRCLPIPESCRLLDWLLATRAWALGASMTFDPEPRMAYRQYARNVARVLPPFASGYILEAAERVLGHYTCALDRSWDLPEPACTRVSAERDRVRGFHAAMSDSSDALARYAAALNRLPPRYIWWWCVAHPDLEAVWSD